MQPEGVTPVSHAADRLSGRRPRPAPLWLLAAWLLRLPLITLQRIRRLKLAHQKQGVVTSLSQGLER